MPSLTLQPAFTGGELSPSLLARVDLAKYNLACRTLLNFKIQPHGGAVKRPGFLLLDLLPGEAHLIKFVFNTEQAYCLAFGQNWLQVFTPDGPVLAPNGAVYQTASPYTLAQARSLSTAQSADVLFLASRDRPPTKLQRLAHNNWSFQTMSFNAPLAAPAGVSASGSAGPAPYRYYVTAVGEAGQESQLSAPAYFAGPAANNWTAEQSIDITWGPVAGAAQYRLFKSEYGGTPGYIHTDALGVRSFQDRNVAPVFTEGVPVYDNPFPDDDWPGVVGFFEQRLVFASSRRRPQTLWMSKTGDYGNFARYTPLTDDAPLELTIASSEVSPLLWLQALRTLILGGTSMEWEVKSAGGAFSAQTAQVAPQSYAGSAPLPPLVAGNTVLHVARNRSQARDLKYDFGSDSYRGSDCSIMASHLFERHKISGWTYQQYPDSVVWIVREDGALIGLTYQAEHEVFAWHRHETQGNFKAVLALPAGREDTLFALVERAGVFGVERLAESHAGGDYSRAVFLDSALTYEGPPVDAVSGLGHLEGRRVGILADGAVMAPRPVVNGRVNLDWPAAVIVVGLEYTADLETMPAETTGPGGSTVGRKKQINEIAVLFHETAGAQVGTRFDRLETIKWRGDEPYGSPPRAFSGLRSAVVPGLAENQNFICLRSGEPTPLTVLAVMAKMEAK